MNTLKAIASLIGAIASLIAMMHLINSADTIPDTFLRISYLSVVVCLCTSSFLVCAFQLQITANK